MNITVSSSAELTKDLLLLGNNFSQSTKSSEANHQILKLSVNMRNSCLPKMLCEIAAKPRTALSDKEKTLLDLLT